MATTHGLSTFHIQVEGSDALVTANLTVSSEEPVNYWEISWIKPTNASIISIKDRHGPIDSYTVNSDTVSIQTNTETPRQRDRITIRMRIPNAVNTHYSPINQLELSLPGFQNENTTVVVNTSHILAGKTPLGFTEYYSDSMFVTQGKGPVSIHLLFANRSPRYKHFFITGEYNLTPADRLYYLPQGITGRKLPYKTLAIAVLPEHQYKQEAWKWSEGTYVGAGLILMPQSVFANNSIPVPIILHEATHAINARVLQWDRSNQSWFDEGVAQYVELLAQRKRNEHVPALFGEPRQFVKNGQRYVLKPRQTPDNLWEYYQNNRQFMHRWHPTQAHIRSFGYAYSELMIRAYVAENSPDSLHTVYEQLAQRKQPVKRPRTSSQLILSVMNFTSQPCFATDKSILIECLNRIQQANYSVPIVASDEQRNQKPKEVIPTTNWTTSEPRIEQKTKQQPLPVDTTTADQTMWQAFVNTIQKLWQQLGLFG